MACFVAGVDCRMILWMFCVFESQRTTRFSGPLEIAVLASILNGCRMSKGVGIGLRLTSSNRLC